MSKQSKIQYNLQLKGRAPKKILFLQEDALADVGSVSPTLVDDRALKDAIYNSKENETELKWEEKFHRTAPDNDSPPALVPRCHPGM